MSPDVGWDSVNKEKIRRKEAKGSDSAINLMHDA
jgi:hypothetical protein